MAIPLFFLGAGASREFNIPTMTEMVQRFENHLKKENSELISLYSEIKDILTKGYDKFHVDIESIFSVIQGIADDVTPKDMGHYPFYYMMRCSFEQTFSDDQKKHAQILRSMLEQFIKNQCKISGSDDENQKIYERSYDVFFKNLMGVTFRQNNAGLDYAEKWRGFTTNYDLVFENYWSELAPISDFFELTGGMSTLDTTKGLGERCFIKLHGSVDWEKLEDGDVIKSSPSTSFTRRKKKGTAMLYPIQQKDLYKYPWDTLFQSLKQGLKNSDWWYIVGYALNDEFILNIFIEIFNSTKTIVIINPHAEDLRNKFPESMRSNIKTLKAKFGSEYFPQDFEDFSKNKRTLEIELSSESPSLGIDFPVRVEKNQLKILENDNRIYDTLITHHDNRSFVDFQNSKEDEFKKIKFRVELNGFSNFKDNIEFRVSTRSKKLINVTISNQGRLIDTFTASDFQYDDEHGTADFSEPRSIPIDKFWPK